MAPIRPAGIMELKSEEVYTMIPARDRANLSGLAYAQSVANGTFSQENEWYEQWDVRVGRSLPHVYHQKQLPLDFGDMEDPVPASLYYDAKAEECWGEQIHCRTITDGTYRPRLAFNEKFWASALPGWNSCSWPTVVDPPIALSPIKDSTTQVPLMPTEMPGQQTQNAQPSVQFTRPWPPATATATTTATAIITDGYFPSDVEAPPIPPHDNTLAGPTHATNGSLESYPASPSAGASTKVHKGQILTISGSLTTVLQDNILVDPDIFETTEDTSKDQAAKLSTKVLKGQILTIGGHVTTVQEDGILVDSGGLGAARRASETQAASSAPAAYRGLSSNTSPFPLGIAILGLVLAVLLL
jgi:hypothetical protein